MNKKSLKKSHSRNKSRKKSSHIYLRYIFIGSLALLFFIGLKYSQKSELNVLGISILARGEDQPDQMQNNIQNKQINNEPVRPDVSGQPMNVGRLKSNEPVRPDENIKVYKDIKQSGEEQIEFNKIRKNWEDEARRNGFQIEPLPSGFQPQKKREIQVVKEIDGQIIDSNQINTVSAIALKDLPTIRGNFNVPVVNSKNDINLNDGTTKIRLGMQGLDFSAKAIRADGAEIEIEKEAINKINTVIKMETGVEIKNNGNNFVMKRGEMEAQTKFPISFNVATKTFTITTKTGEQEIKLLPDEVINNLIDNKSIASVDVVSSINGYGEAISSGIELTELDNKVIYQVKGRKQKKIFGFLPISIPKTTFVSADTGELIKTDQTIWSSILETVSF